MPKHLYSGKTSNGARDRRWYLIVCIYLTNIKLEIYEFNFINIFVMIYRDTKLSKIKADDFRVGIKQRQVNKS